ncbi:MAG: 2'-deoxycytidine 5'-triphosphate deaminase domain-containing protein [Steroidobacteraceae bacterium]
MHEIPEGVLNSDQLRELRSEEVILSPDALDAKGSAFDLHLGTRGWILRGSIKQVAALRESVETVCERYGVPFQLDASGFVLKKGQVAVLELREKINFSQHPWLNGEATGKSSIGRLDILTRLLVDGWPEYERVPLGYQGPLYVEIAPISFDIRIYPKASLNQLRIHCGPRHELASLIGRRLLFKSHDGREFCANAQDNHTLSLDISPSNTEGLRPVAFVLRQNLLKELDFQLKGSIDPGDYFEPVRSDDDALDLAVNRFYILRSIERLALPENIAVTGMAYSENLGELRIHYAGFAHPWFGMDRADGRVGTPLIFEVRAHSFPIVLRNQEVFATIRFYKMSQPIPDCDKEQESNDYTNQELKLSNYFAPRTDWPPPTTATGT